MIPQHEIDTGHFRDAFERDERTFGIVSRTVIKADQTSEPLDKEGYIIISQYITSKEVMCVIDVDQLLYNEMVEEEKRGLSSWFEFYISGTHTDISGFTTFNTSVSAETFSKIADEYKGISPNFEADDDEVLGEEYTCGYYAIPEGSKIIFTHVIAYDKACVDTEGSIAESDPPNNTLDYRYKALVMNVGFINTNKEGEEETEITFGVVSPEPEYNLTFQEAIDIYNSINVHEYNA